LELISGNALAFAVPPAVAASAKSNVERSSIRTRGKVAAVCCVALKISAVAYDEAIAERVRALIGVEPGLTEQKMFGGLAFLVHGNMAVAASGQGGVLVRVDPGESAALVERTPAYAMVMRGRSMDGWLRVDSDDVRDDGTLGEWVARGVGYARSLPPKKRS
jgi:hypothetical protein